MGMIPLFPGCLNLYTIKSLPVFSTIQGCVLQALGAKRAISATPNELPLQISCKGFLFDLKISFRNFSSGILAIEIIMTKSSPLICTSFGLPIPNHKAPIFFDARYKSICSPRYPMFCRYPSLLSL